MCMHESGMVLVLSSAGTIGGGIIAEPYSPYNSRRLFRQRKNRKSLSKFGTFIVPYNFPLTPAMPTTTDFMPYSRHTDMFRHYG